MRDSISQFLIVLFFMNLGSGSELWKDERTKFLKKFTDVYQELKSKDDKIDSFKTEMTGLLVQHKSEVKQLLNVHNETTESHENISDIIDSFKTEMKDLLVQYKNEVKIEVQQEMEDLGVNVLYQAPSIGICSYLVNLQYLLHNQRCDFILNLRYLINHFSLKTVVHFPLNVLNLVLRL